MTIGIFDSGLGGLLMTHSLIKALPEHNYIYLGDTAHVPYGDRGQAEIYDYTRQGISYLLERGCRLIIIACNTASAEALPRIQHQFAPRDSRTPRVLGVLIPAAESAISLSPSHRIGVLATRSTIQSGAFTRELLKLDPSAQVTAIAAPELVPLIEQDRAHQADVVLDRYLKQFPEIDTLILGCTHYPYLKTLIRQKLSPKIAVISQDEILPAKVSDYLARHPALASSPRESSGSAFLVTKLTPHTVSVATRLFQDTVELTEVALPADN